MPGAIAPPAGAERSGGEQSGVARRRPRPTASSLAIAAGSVIALAYALYVISPRFGIRVPATIDDWGSASQPDKSFGQLVGPFFEHTGGRFRPGFDLFDHAMWHTLGAPAMTGPNVWNVLRIALFVAAIALVPALVARSVRPSLSPLTLFGLAALPTGLVIVGGISVDFARLEPQEPILVGATVCGGALVLLGADRLVRGCGRRGTVVAIAAGWPLFLLGIFFKEASVAYAVLLAAAFAHLLSRWRRLGLVRSWRDPLRDRRVLLVAALLVIPQLWVTYRVATAGGQGANLYGGGSPHGLSEWVDRFRVAWRTQWYSMTGYTGTTLWHGLAVGVPLLAAATWLDRRRVPWLPIGFLVTGLLMLAIQGLPGIVVTRYFIPTMAMLAIAAVLALAEARAWLRVAALVAAAVVALNFTQVSHTGVASWAAGEKQTGRFIDYNAGLVRQGCTLHITGVDPEFTYSLPSLIGLRAGHAGPGPCPVAGSAIVVSYSGVVPGPDPKTYGDVWAVCRSPVRRIYASGAFATSVCGELKARVGSAPATAVLHAYLLVPGVSVTARGACMDAHPGDPRCDRPRLDRNQRWP